MSDSTPALPSAVGDGKESSHVRALRQQKLKAEAFGLAAERFLALVYPNYRHEAKSLVASYIAFATAGLDEYMEAALSYEQKYPIPSLKSDEELLIQLIEARDALADQVAEVEKGLAAMEEMVGPEMSRIVKVTAKQMYNDRLSQCETDISALQQRIEQRAHAVNPNPSTKVEESGNT